MQVPDGLPQRTGLPVPYRGGWVAFTGGLGPTKQSGIPTLPASEHRCLGRAARSKVTSLK